MDTDKDATQQLPISLDDSVLRDFCRRWQVKAMGVFGSVLTERFRRDSDVDIWVEFAPSAHVGLLALGRMERELTEMVGRKVDLVTPGGLKPRLREQILSQSRMLYAS